MMYSSNVLVIFCFCFEKGETLDDIPMAVLTDCAQLVKANSIQGKNMLKYELLCPEGFFRPRTVTSGKIF